jgi:hypothetical protein
LNSHVKSYLGVILSGAVLQAERRIPRGVQLLITQIAPLSIDSSRAGSVDSSAYDGCVLTNEDKQWIEERLEGLSEKIEKVETTLLTEFHKWASPQEMRQRTHAAAIRALDA